MYRRMISISANSVRISIITAAIDPSTDWSRACKRRENARNLFIVSNYSPLTACQLRQNRWIPAFAGIHRPETDE